jgi:uncharacterized protein YggT (Ycf19 family)
MQIYLLLLFLRVLLSWFPAFNWERQPWLALRQVQSHLSMPPCLYAAAACIGGAGLAYMVTQISASYASKQ